MYAPDRAATTDSTRIERIAYARGVTPPECPRCLLPTDDSAWQCDGCGHEFSRDFEAVRTRLRAQLRASWRLLGVMIVVDLAIVAAIVVVAQLGLVVISAGLALAALGSTGHAVFRITSLRASLRELDHRHRPLPTAVVR